MVGFTCARCGECCRRYFIVSLPREVNAQASLLGISERYFVQKKMWLYLQLFPAEPSEDKMNLRAKGLPKKIVKKIAARLGFIPETFIALPMLCFRRQKKGECIFYPAKSGCAIYPARPKECELFPFISLKEDADYAKLYPFCKGLATKANLTLDNGGQDCHGPGKGDYANACEHFAEVTRHLGGVKENGFKKTWGSWPKEGVCLLEGKLLCKINEKEFFDAIGEYA